MGEDMKRQFARKKKKREPQMTGGHIIKCTFPVIITEMNCDIIIWHCTSTVLTKILKSENIKYWQDAEKQELLINLNMHILHEPEYFIPTCVLYRK